MTAEIIQLDRRRKPAALTADQAEEQRMELAVRNAESLMVARRTYSHASAAMHALAVSGASVPLADHHIAEVMRLAVREIRRATATEPEPTPVALRKAA